MTAPEDVLRSQALVSVLADAGFERYLGGSGAGFWISVDMHGGLNVNFRGRFAERDAYAALRHLNERGIAARKEGTKVWVTL